LLWGIARIKRQIMRLMADGQRRSLSTIVDRVDAPLNVTCYALRQLSTGEGKLLAILRLRPGARANRSYILEDA